MKYNLGDTVVYRTEYDHYGGYSPNNGTRYYGHIVGIYFDSYENIYSIHTPGKTITLVNEKFIESKLKASQFHSQLMDIIEDQRPEYQPRHLNFLYASLCDLFISELLSLGLTCFRAIQMVVSFFIELLSAYLTVGQV